MWSTWLAVVSLVGSGIQAGALVMFLAGVCPTMGALPVPQWVGVHQSMDRSIERFMPALNVATSATALAVLFASQDGVVRGLRIVALCCNISLALISELVSVPINRQVKAAYAAEAQTGALSGAERLAALRTRWITAHRWRTLVTCTAFALFAAGAAAGLR